MKGFVKNKNLLQFDLLRKDSNLFHFMTTRHGGVSHAEYYSFNLGEFAGDAPSAVAKNRSLLTSALDISIKRLILPHQVHGDKILKVDEAFLSLPQEEQKEKSSGFDALVTNRPNICIGVTTADCVPILAYDPQEKVLAAIHAGWRGTVAKIATKSIRFMLEEYGCSAKDILVGIGACISQQNFEVDNDVIQKFRATDIDIDQFSYRHPLSNKFHIDLQAVNKDLLLREGILPENIDTMHLCTYTQHEQFFSARRQGIDSGRMVTGGVVKGI